VSPLDLVINIGKMLAFMAAAMFLLCSALAQWTYWTKNESKDFPHLTKKYKMLYRFGFYEFWAFVVGGCTFVVVALVRLLWWAVTTGW
jgi:hypothetical protein